MHSNSYTFLYAIVISVITAILLAFAAEGLRPLQEANVRLDNKTSILRAVRFSSTDREEIEVMYRNQVEEAVLDHTGEKLSGIKVEDIVLKKELEKPLEQRRLPLYIFTSPDFTRKFIIPMQGTGLWGPVFGYISIEEDFNTVYGAYFTHKSETPGLGAEISEKPFQDQFQGKKIMSADNSFISVHVVKPAAKVSFGAEHRVDAISGGTITSNGVDKMLKDCIAPYLPYFEKIKKTL